MMKNSKSLQISKLLSGKSSKSNSLNYSEIFLSKMKKDTNFEEFLNQNYAIQLDINFSFEFPVVINNSSFFVSENKKNIFTHEFFTDSYIYIVKNPYDIYKKNKSIHRNKFDSLNYLLNSDHHFYTYLSQDGLKLDLPREGGIQIIKKG